MRKLSIVWQAWTIEMTWHGKGRSALWRRREGWRSLNECFAKLGDGGTSMWIGGAERDELRKKVNLHGVSMDRESPEHPELFGIRCAGWRAWREIG